MVYYIKKNLSKKLIHKKTFPKTNNKSVHLTNNFTEFLLRRPILGTLLVRFLKIFLVRYSPLVLCRCAYVRMYAFFLHLRYLTM